VKIFKVIKQWEKAFNVFLSERKTKEKKTNK
jgi:hypothetical protein